MEPVRDFLSAIKELKPTAIIGVSGRAGSFTQEMVEELSRINERPIVFSLSNPTSKAECTAAAGLRVVRRTRGLRQRQPVRSRGI